MGGSVLGLEQNLEARLQTLFQDWYSWTVDLPGTFFLEAVDKLYKRNELAAGSFIALGQRIDLKAVKVPIFLLAARDDRIGGAAAVIRS